MRESQGSGKSTVEDKVLKVAFKVCEKRLKELDEMIDDPTSFAELVTDDEWKVLGADEMNVESLAQKKHEDWLAKNEVMQAEKKKQEKIEEKKRKKKKKPKAKKTTDGEDDDGAGEDLDGWNKDGEDEEEDIIDDEEEDDKKNAN